MPAAELPVAPQDVSIDSASSKQKIQKNLFSFFASPPVNKEANQSDKTCLPASPRVVQSENKPPAVQNVTANVPTASHLRSPMLSSPPSQALASPPGNLVKNKSLNDSPSQANLSKRKKVIMSDSETEEKDTSLVMSLDRPRRQRIGKVMPTQRKKTDRKNYDSDDGFIVEDDDEEEDEEDDESDADDDYKPSAVESADDDAGDALLDGEEEEEVEEDEEADDGEEEDEDLDDDDDDDNSKRRKRTHAKSNKKSAPSFSKATGKSSQRDSVSTPSSVKSHSSSVFSTPSSMSSLGSSRPAKDRTETRHPWLQNVLDGNKNPIGHPDYDPRTLYIPPSAEKALTPFEKQYWDLKKNYFDTVVFLKKGKFYELYENDADIGHQKFDLKMTDRVNMRMVGVPEVSFQFWASKFIAAGYKVAKVDQIETAIGKSIREKDDRGQGKRGKEEKIIRRELTSILTGGTLTDPGLLTQDHHTYCLSLKEHVHHSTGSTRPATVCYGVFFVDTATAEFSVSYLEDDVHRTLLETLLMQLRPKELVYEKGNLTPETLRILKNTLSDAPLWNALQPGKEFWDAHTTRAVLHDQAYFPATWPAALQRLRDNDLVLSAVGGLLWYLQFLRIDRTLLSLGHITAYAPLLVGPSSSQASLILDGQTLANLEILANNVDGSEDGTLARLLNRCVTPFGKRLFRTWLCHPSRDIATIEARLDAVDLLLKEDGWASELAASLATLPDLERSLARVHAGTCRLPEFLQLLRSCTTALALLAQLQAQPLIAARLQRVDDALLRSELAYFDAAFDHDRARRDHYVTPHRGVLPEDDEVCDTITHLQSALSAHLDEQRALLRVKTLSYRDIGKEIYQMEVPAHVKVPDEYMIMSKTKQVKRYYTPRIRALVKELLEAQERSTLLRASLYARILQRFDEGWTAWHALLQALAHADALLSLAASSRALGTPACRPQFIVSPTAVFEARDLRHPCMAMYQTPGTSFIPNDVHLGGTQASTMLLTGPNMGGKSTMLRQTCIAVLMAQLGCYVAAASCRLTPVDRIFTRIGAHDNILAGQSTFMVELQETGKILRYATPASLVILDELGRGTSTFDGYAIAYAVLHHLLVHTGCLALFSTHYHLLCSEFVRHPLVRLAHMACVLDDAQQRVVFLYRLVEGACPRSYGMNVARMAGLSETMVARAERVARDFEESHGFRDHLAARQQQGALPMTTLADMAALMRVVMKGGREKRTDEEEGDRVRANTLYWLQRAQTIKETAMESVRDKIYG